MILNSFKEKINTVVNGDSLAVLKTFPDECVDSVITSPPYWALRDYGVAGQLGLEPIFDCGIKENNLMKLKEGLTKEQLKEIYKYFDLEIPV